MITIIFSVAKYCFGLGLFGLMVQQRNLILVLIALELILLGLSSFFVFYSFYLPNISGQLYALLILTLAGAESALGLALVMIIYRLTGTIALQRLTNLKH
jgi:NADH-quinone oxidoreductase subunit K